MSHRATSGSGPVANRGSTELHERRHVERTKTFARVVRRRHEQLVTSGSTEGDRDAPASRGNGEPVVDRLQ